MDLNDEEDIRMEDSRKDHWRVFSGYDDDQSKIRSLR